MMPMTIIGRVPSDFLIDGIASGFLGALVILVVTVTLGRWFLRRLRSGKVI